MRRGQEFANLVHGLLVTDERGRTAEIANSMGLSYDALYARLRNRVVFSPEEIRSLIAVLPDARIASWLLLGTGFFAAERGALDQPDLDARESLRHSVIRMIVDASEAAAQVEIALSDGRIDHREAAQIQKDILAAERAIATLKAHVKEFETQKS
ncbi:phage regulatory CII family protein [Ruegeria halocynthiae]|uniref:phage regulatory CII family protein n=1 Tax=Ruegeria halocynthiae TaxID=985054 RepID=UPI000565B7A6|nr:phage regulatory CII family protein [Ruegeria halocynthiae]